MHNHKNIVVLSSTNAFNLNDTFAVHNPTAVAISATLAGSIKVYDSGYVDAVSTTAILVQPGGTLYGRFTSVTGSGLICMY